MDFSSLSKYPTPQRPASAECARKSDAGLSPLSPRGTRILLSLVFVVAIAAMLYQLRGMMNAIEHPTAPAPVPPLDFKLVRERYEDVRLSVSRDEVEALLGPPTEPAAGGPDLQAEERKAEQFHKDFGIPSQRFWQKWSDPKDEDQWVAVLYGGTYAPYTIYWKVKKGF